MPVRLLTEAERERLSAFPKEIPTEDLFSYFTLTGPDRATIPARSAPANRLGFALSLCAVRYLGFCPEDLSAAPADVAWYVSEQLGVPAEALKNYGERPQTRTDHLLEVHRHLGYRRPSEAELADLSRWLVERALEHDDPSLLFRTAAERFKAEKLVRPGLWLLERMVTGARERAHEETFRAVSALLTLETRARLDGLLVAGATSRPTPLARLGQGATSNTPKAILDQLAKLDLLRGMGADRWNLSAVNPNRLKRLSRLGRRYTAQALHRQAPERRYPILLAFLRDSSAEITDEVVDLFDACLAQADAKARRELEEFRRGAARATNEKVGLFRQIGRLLLDPGVPDERVRAAAYEIVGSPEGLLRAVEECERLARPVDDNYFDFLAQRYSYIRQFAPAFLSAFDFRGGREDDPLLAAVGLLKEMNASGRRRVPDDAPLGFVPAKWEPYVMGEDGRIDRRYWELCVLTALRWALRSGDVWVEGSRRYADPQSYLIPKERWPSVKPEVRVLTGSSPDGVEHLRECREELAGALARLEDEASRGNRVQVQADKLVFRRDRSEGLSESALALSGEVGARLPKVELADLLVEVDRWTGFLKAFEHAGGSEPRGKDLNVHLLASVLARATNLGPSNMAELSGLSYRSLAWAANWYVREETLKSAIAAVVDHHYRLPLSRRWGGGTLSSSDGQRFPVAVKARNARALPRYFGYGRGVTFYSWTSDQFSQYGTKVIPSTVRDATYVLDEILGNETELPIAEHTVDTHGFTEIVFGLFSLLGLRFSPRIRDVADQRLYGMEGVGQRADGRGGLGSRLLQGRVDEKLILRHWDDIARVAGSLKMGWVTSSSLVSRLQAKPRKSGLTKALQEYGRLRKTIFLLRYMEDVDLRKRIGRQLNKGESLHALRDFLFFANAGKIGRRQPEEQTDQALCLNLVADCVILWNTVYYQEILTRLKEEGYPLRSGDVDHLSPTKYAHVNPYGRYRFDPEAVPAGELRPLRNA